MTIRDLVDNITVQGHIEVRELKDDDVNSVWEDDDFTGITKNLEPYADREIAYMYPVPVNGKRPTGRIVIEIK